MRIMGRTRRALLACVAALAVTVTLAPGASAADRPKQERRLPQLQARAADDVVDAYGIGIHLNFLNTPYRDADAVTAALTDLGVRHVRDDLYLDAPRQYAAITTVASRGIGFNLIMGRPGNGAPQDYVDVVADRLPAGAVESIEGVNEWDLFSGGGDWVTEMKDWQAGLWAAAKARPATADLPVLSPALAFRWNYAEAGDLSEHADVANAHMYPGGHRPSNEITRITNAVRTSVPDGPLITTEAGYHNALNTSNGHRPVPEDVAGAYLPRLLLEHVGRGEQRMYSYELIDSFPDPDLDNPEAHFGLLRHDLTPKPAYTAMRNLLALLADPGPSIEPGTLGLAAQGLPSDARHLLTEKRDGSWVLLLWRDVSLWDADAQQPLTVTPAEVSVQLESDYELTVLRPSESTEPVHHTAGSSVPLSLDGQVTAVEIEPIDPEEPPLPTDVTVERGDGRATVRWGLADSDVAATGFRVTRLPDGEPQVVGPDVRSYDDTGLVNGETYSYEVRALTASGPSAAVASPEFVAAGVPVVPARPKATPGKRKVTVTWVAADPRGSAVTAYRLTVLGRTVDVGPDALRKTIRGLPAKKRLRVGVRARNEVGWGPVVFTKFVRTR